MASPTLDARLVQALAEIEEAEESLRSARALIRALFESTLPQRVEGNG